MIENTAIKEEIEQVLLDTEKELGLHITIHDRTGRFIYPDGSPLLYRTRTIHSHSVCKKTDPEKCIADCYYSVNEQAKNRAAAWEHLCWKGVIEIIVPITLNSEHLLTLFGGSFRPASGDAPSAEIAKLPAADSIKLQRAARILAVLAEGLLAKVSRLHVEEDQSNNRRTTIKRFLHSYAHRSISLSDLAKILYLSESRTSHVVKDLFGKSFRELVIEERVMRAKVMLQSRDEPVSLIARDVGFPDEYHFNRMFKKIVGTPPGKFRRAMKRDIS